MKIKVIKDPYGKVGYVGKVYELSVLQTITVEDPVTKEWFGLNFYDHDKQFVFVDDVNGEMSLSEHLKKIKEIIG